MSGTIIPQAEQQFCDINGHPLANGYVYMYVPNTTTFKDTFQDPALTIRNTNPIRLDGSGRAIIWGTGSYRQIVQDANANLIYDQVTEDTTGGLLGGIVDSTFLAGSGFTPGTTTTLTLAAGPGSVANMWIYFDGVYQADSNVASISGTTLTFTAPIPVGTTVVTVKIGATVAIGTPGAGTVVDTSLGRPSRIYNAAFSRNVTQLINTPGTVSTWQLFTPQGDIVDISASTTCGLQEAINYATTNGYNLEVIGCTATPAPGVQYGILFCSTAIQFPALRSTSVRMVGVHVIFTAAVTGAGMTFDSMDLCDIEIIGEIVYQGNGNAVSFRPTLPVPVDGGTFIDASRVHIGAVVTNGGAPNCCIIFDTGVSSISFLDFSCDEVNGAGAVGQPPSTLYGVLVGNPQANTAFEMNTIKLGHVHQFKNAGVQIGTTQTQQQNMRGNIWDIGSLKPQGTNSTSALNTFGQGDQFRIGGISNEEGAFGYGIVVQPGADYNGIDCGVNLGAGVYGTLLNSGSALNRVWVGEFAGAGAAFLDNGSQNYRLGAAKSGNTFTANTTVIYEPDGTIVQTMNNVQGNTGGAVTSFPVAFPLQCDSCIATCTNQVVAFSASANQTSVTITSASGTPNFNVIARGR